MRWGLLGGTFDPIHNGHLALARAALAQLRLDGVWLLPAGVPWMKRDAPRSPNADRLRMVELAIDGIDRLYVLTAELERPGDTHTVDTLDGLRAGTMAGDDLYFVVGADALASMHRWKEPRRLLEMAQLAVAARSGGVPPLEQLEAVAPGASARVIELRMESVNVSATDLRRRVRAGEPIRGDVPDAVADYIHEQGLYTAPQWANESEEAQ